MDPFVPSSRCPACGAALSDGWCARCALAAALAPGEEAGAEKSLFTVPGHLVLAELGRGGAGIVAALDHPVILPVLSVGEYDGLPYYTMKLCAGGSLAGRLARYHDDPRAVAELMVTLAGAVQHAHARGVLHRDLKPENILFDEADRPFVSDFGLAKIFKGSAAPGGPATRPLLVMGTPGYMAP